MVNEMAKHSSQSYWKIFIGSLPDIPRTKVKVWGLKSFRFLNMWRYHAGFRDFVMTKWRSYDIEGWGSYVLKEKFKRLRRILKAGIRMCLDP